ncbi:hypothetical protein LQ327_29875 [Actinomycetospora endophytica]|uniref:Uncharacterized protein n=1 Tax=Actinomycetospora endophytica TaxID=2291215 RepID=A0ABS8PI24_9PSEU|nr:hypothetical protein [Actinomycetospora endophytica]MCD2197587.1 hypothetical protein [Actinomycetospora endophytica]
MSSPASLQQHAVPGGGPRWIGDRAERRARNRWWIRWWWSSAAFGVVGLGFLGAVALVEDPTNVLSAWFGCWMVAILAMVPAYRLGWVARYDRYDDELSRYAHGVRAEMSLRTGDGVVRLGDRIVATSSVDATGRRRMVLDDATLSVDEQILERAGDRSITAVALRLVDEADVVMASARGDRRGDRVDWTIDVPLGELRLRQLLSAVPSRRTLLDDDGCAWRIRGDADAPSWSAELPERAGAIDAVVVTWLACHLDAVGLERCYGAGDGPALTAYRFGGDASRRPVGNPGVRPEVPTASGGGIDL